MPLLSVVIPTRQRPELLGLALQSAMDQTGYDDYEVVVSANGDPDETRAVVERFTSDRLRYFEIGDDVDYMCSWNFAAGKSEGEYMLLPSDDDALLPDAMALYAEVIEAQGNPDYIATVNGWYGHDSVTSPRQNALRFRTGWDVEGMGDPRQMLSEFFAYRHPTFTPTYALISARIRRVFQDRGVNPYIMPYPDYGMQACALAVAETAFQMKAPTILHGYASDSAGEFAFGRREQVAWTPRDGEDEVFKLAPLKSYNYINGWTETLLRAKEAIPDLFEGLEPDWAQYYFRYAQELLGDGEWRDITDEFNELCKALQGCPEAIRVPLLSSPELLHNLDWLNRMVETRLWDRFDLDFKGDWIQGKTFGFNDIVECTRAASDLFARQREHRDLFSSLVPPKK